MMTRRSRSAARTYAALGLAVALLVPVGSALPAGAAGRDGSPLPATPATPATLTNLAHLDFLGDTVTPPAQAGHTTYKLAQDPELGVLWTYADARDGGTFERVGGGPHNAADNTWAQGSYNVDDLARAAVVYLRHWKLEGDRHSRDRAYQLLRAVTYMQTATGANAGDVVLWMQPDGSLNPSPIPVELPNPSDSDESYWLARSVWALGEGYAAFADVDPAFASFLGDRIGLALNALDRASLSRYGQWDVADGTRVPGWLIVDGADATAEAVLGLSAYVGSAPASADADRARTAASRYAEGIAAMSGGDVQTWPYGAILPWTHSQSDWHAWASQMPAALARASQSLHEPGLLGAAVKDSAVFTPYLLTATGPINGWLPAPTDLTQIAYGVDSRLQSLLAVADAAHRPGLKHLAAIDASWYFGANRAGAAMYDPATGVTYDGMNADGVINKNSGAESAIHGLLSMLALDARPKVAAQAQSSTSLVKQDGVQVIEGESAAVSGGARPVTPASAWTGESLFSSGAYLELGAGGSAGWTVPASGQPRLVQPVVDLVPDAGSAVLDWRIGRHTLGRVDTGTGGEQGVTEAPGALQPVTLPRLLPAGATALSVAAQVSATVPAKVDALLLRPQVSQLVLDGPDGGTVLLQSASGKDRVVKVAVPGTGAVVVRSYDSTGVLRNLTTKSRGTITALVLAGGFTVATR